MMADTTTCLAESVKKILDRRILLLDGGLGTTLEDEYGACFTSKETPMWSSHFLISSPETLLKVQTDFAEAGADIVLTATYQASYNGMAITPALSHWKLESTRPWTSHPEAQALLKSAVDISKIAIQKSGHPGLVALGLGPFGATMIPGQEYTGNYGEIDYGFLHGFHQFRMNAFIDDDEAWKNIDIIAFETLPRLDEIVAVRKVMDSIKTLASGSMLINGYAIPKDRQFDLKPYWISCVFPGDNDKLPDGSPIEDVVKTMMMDDETPLPFAIGINCTKVFMISKLVKKFEEAGDKLGILLPRLVIYPDGAGRKVYDTTLQKWIGEGPEEASWDEQVFEIVKEIQGRGMWTGILVGGCCKTTPDHIAKLRRRLDEWTKS